ncbi:MAG: IS1634 family transposase [Deltaproteobacteria bacterium]|jgi:transposase|nr:IS1634 family transposase [Deltaproteobacteria bacterium]
MGSIKGKKINSNTYYYYVESKRINGKSKTVNQQYLGTAEKLLERARDTEKPLQERALYSVEYDYGMVTLLYDLAVRLDLVGIIDSFVPKRRQGASVGMYILIEAINRVVAPSSTTELQEWYKKTYLPCMTNLSASAFSAQNFWNNASKISEEALERIEDEILSKMLEVYNIDVTNLIYDATNFFTYIDTKQESQLAKRGHCKSKQNDLRVVGLSLMVSPDFSIPLIHETYPGNMNDAKQFANIVNRLKSRCKTLSGRDNEVTLVFDRGNNSEDNINLLISGDKPFHYVGGLKKGQAPDLWAIPKEEYTPLLGDNFTGQSSYRMEVEVFKQKVIGLIVHNPELEKGQMQGIQINIDKTRTKLCDLHERLMKRANGEITKGKKPTVNSVKQSVEDILNVEYMKDIFKYEIIEIDNNVILTFNASELALEKIRHDLLGKTALFTDRRDFSNEEIVGAYRSAWHVEQAFRQMKDTNHLTVRPLFHWTDHKIKVHLFTCVLAYRMCCLLAKELAEQGWQTNVNNLITQMSEIKRILTFFGDLKNPEKVLTYTCGNDLAEHVLSSYRLREKYS